MLTYHQSSASDSGNVTFAILMICTSMFICTITMLAVSEIHLQIEANRGNQQVDYAAAKGVALSAIHLLDKGKIPSSSTQSMGKVLVHSVVKNGPIVLERVSATYMGATDTISFSYDTISKKLINWQDNGPSS